MVTWSCLWFPFALVQYRQLWREVRQQAHLRRPCVWYKQCVLRVTTTTSSVSRVSQRIGILSLEKLIIVDTSVLLHWYYGFVLPIIVYCSPVWGSAAESHGQLLGRQVNLIARLCPDQSFLLMCHRRHVAGLCMVCKVNSNSNHC